MRCTICNSKCIPTVTKYDWGAVVTVFDCPKCEAQIGAIGFIPWEKKVRNND